MSRKNIAVVCGGLSDVEMLHFLEPLSQYFSIRIYLLKQSDRDISLSTSLDIYIFEPVPNMPGYMRGLEKVIGRIDAAICFESSHLASFQLARYCQKINCPYMVITTEIKSFQYLEHQNIQAIQSEVYAKAQCVIPSSRCAQRVLNIEERDVKDHGVIYLGTDIDSFKIDRVKHQKFRKYIGMSTEDYLCLVYTDEVDDHTLLNYIDAFKIYDQLHQSKHSLKFLFAGSRSVSHNIKYRAAELGLGAKLVLIQQDLSPFLHDLYAACDFLLYGGTHPSEYPVRFPRWIIDAMASGVRPLMSKSQISDEILSDAYSAIDMEPSAIALALKEQISIINHSSIEAYKTEMRDFASQMWSGQKFSQAWQEQLTLLCLELVESDAFYDGLLARLQRIAEQNQWQELVAASECLVKDDELLIDARFTEAVLLRAEAFRRLDQHNQAMMIFEKVLAQQPESVRCYIGLGRISLATRSYQNAVSFYKKAVDLKPDAHEALLGMGLAEKHLGRDYESLLWLKQSVAYGSTKALLMLIQVCLGYHDSVLAIETLEWVREELAIEDSALLYALGSLYIKSGLHRRGEELVSCAKGDQQNHS